MGQLVKVDADGRIMWGSPTGENNFGTDAWLNDDGSFGQNQFEPNTPDWNNRQWEINHGYSADATPTTLKQARELGYFGKDIANIPQVDNLIGQLFQSKGLNEQQAVSAAAQGLKAHQAKFGQGYTTGSSLSGIFNDFILPAAGVAADQRLETLPGWSRQDAESRAKRAADIEHGGDFGSATGLGQILSYQSNLGGNVLEAWKQDPERAFLGINTPAESEAWGALTGKDYRPTVDMMGGNTAYDTQSAKEKGIDTQSGEAMHQIAKTVTGQFAGGALKGLASDGVGALSAGTESGSTGSASLTGDASTDTLGGGTMADEFDPSLFQGGDTNDFFSGFDDTPTNLGDGGAFDMNGSQGVFDTQGNPLFDSSDGGAFDMGASEGVFDAQGNPIAGGGSGLLDLAKKYGQTALGLAKKLLGGDTNAMKSLLGLGVPAAAIAGLFEKNKSPLIASQVNASRGALAGADKFAALPDIPMTPSQKRAVETANADTGNWKPYFDKAGALADTGAGGITPETTNKYFNPELQGVLDPTIRDINEATAARREKLRAEVARSGNDYYGPGTEPTRFNVSDSLLDRENLRAIGDATGKIRNQAWTDATTLAGKDLDRSLTASNLYGGLGKSAGALGSVDFQNLSSAGALERQPMEDARTHAADTSKLYTGVVSGINPAVAGSTPQSTLSKATGALGALSTAKDIGLY